MWGLRLARVVGLAVPPRATAIYAPFLSKQSLPRRACVLVRCHKCVTIVEGASWDVTKRKLGQAAARASGADTRAGLGPRHTSGLL